MEQQHTVPVTFSDEQWRTCQDAIWCDIEATSTSGDRLQAQVDSTYDQALFTRPYQMLSASQREDLETYLDVQKRLTQARDREAALLGLLEKIEEGTAVPADVMPFLPQDEEENMAKTERPAEVATSWLAVMGDMVSATDPTRISSGRNRRMLKAVGGMVISTDTAESLFYEVTADTHGGKVRRPGKGGKYYTGSTSGRRIRKY